MGRLHFRTAKGTSRILLLVPALFFAVLRLAAQTTPAVQEGTASYYGYGFDGLNTASGEILHKDSLTAASKTIPLGTWVRVRNLSNDSVVIVQVNDRMPYWNPRLIDLSEGAARRLGFMQQGTTQVQVTCVNNPHLAIQPMEDSLFSTVGDSALGLRIMNSLNSPADSSGNHPGGSSIRYLGFQWVWAPDHRFRLLVLNGEFFGSYFNTVHATFIFYKNKNGLSRQYLGDQPVVEIHAIRTRKDYQSEYALLTRTWQKAGGTDQGILAGFMHLVLKDSAEFQSMSLNQVTENSAVFKLYNSSRCATAAASSPDSTHFPVFNYNEAAQSLQYESYTYEEGSSHCYHVSGLLLYDAAGSFRQVGDFSEAATH